jgi:HlyD family secretion protein
MMTLRRILMPLGWLAAAAAAALLVKMTILAPVEVKAVRLERRDLTARAYGNGTVEARVVVAVSSKVTGRIKALMVDQGDRVKRGQLLARLEDEDFSQQELQAEAGVKKAAAMLATEEAGLRKARASHELAERNAKRFRSLVDKEFVSRLDAEQYETNARLAAEEVERCTAATEAARLEQAATRASRGFAESRRRDMAIYAPEDGIVISRDMEMGATVSPGLPIFRIADPANIWVKANVDESQLAGISEGKSATISLRSDPGRKIEGKVARIGRESDRVTEELEVDVAFAAAPQDFRLGEQAEVLVVTGSRRNAPSLPAAAIVSRGKARGAWTIRDGRLAFREIAVGIEDRDGFVEVLSGIDEGTAVALAPPEKAANFKDGMRVGIAR